MRLHRRFLNRLLGLPMARQNLLFNYFACTLAAEIRAAKAEGRYYEGVSDLGGSHVSKVEPQVPPKCVTTLSQHTFALLVLIGICYEPSLSLQAPFAAVCTI